jgi:hypothetical protein
MLNLRSTLLTLAACLAFSQAWAADEVPTHFLCDFDKGYSWTYDAGKFQSAPPADLSFEIGNIDLDKQTASLILGGKTSGTLRVVRALNANHFLEVANEGFLNLTTIYDLDSKTGKYPAVHSRHFGFFGQPVFAQYAGGCVAKPDK